MGHVRGAAPRTSPGSAWERRRASAIGETAGMTDLLIRRRASGRRPRGRPPPARRADVRSPSTPASPRSAQPARTPGLLGGRAGGLVRRRRRQPTAPPAARSGRGRRLAARPRRPDLHLEGAVVTAIPLGLTLCAPGGLPRRPLGRRQVSQVEDLASLGLGDGGARRQLRQPRAGRRRPRRAGPRAEPDLVGAFLGGALLAAAAGAAGLVVGSGLRSEFRALLPGHVRAALFGGAVGLLALWAAGATLAALAVALRGRGGRQRRSPGSRRRRRCASSRCCWCC